MPDTFNRNWPTLAITALLVALALAGCTSYLTPYGVQAVEERKAMNDAQAQLAVLGMCDVAIGAAVREWSREELALAFLICNPTREPVDMARLAAPGSVP